MKIVETNLKFKNTPQKRLTTNKIVIHHSASKVANAQLIHQWHIARGWSGMGYHFLVRKEGGIVETGRPINTIGVHCTGQNNDSVGICFEGDFDRETMTNEQLQTGRELIAYLREIYGQNIRIVRHKDLMATDCPGKNFPFEALCMPIVAAKKSKKKKAKKYSGTLPTLPEKEKNQYYLEKGDKGDNVKLLQRFLNWYGNYGLVIDGDFGNKTLSAVKNYQSKEGLVVDGLFGSKCLKKASSIKK